MTTTILTEAHVLEALRAVRDPDLHRDIVTLGFVKNLRLDGGKVAFDVELTTPACPVKALMHDQAAAAVKALPGVESVAVNMTSHVRAAAQPSDSSQSLARVKNVIAVASGKGGVGKSTVAVNLALALARTGARVGLMDADVYGPSVVALLGVPDEPGGQEVEGGRIIPARKHGLTYISMGLFIDRDAPVIWRGPMASKLIQQFLGQVDWGELDYLLIDLPPGTGDVQLTVTQVAPLMGAVIVTTPQDVAVGITLRGLRMFEQVRVPILGIVENMSMFVCAHCGNATPLLGHGGGQRAATELGYPFLGEIPLDPAITAAGDEGVPVVVDERHPARRPAAAAFMRLAEHVAQQVSIVNEATRQVRFHPEDVHVAEGSIDLRWSDGHVSHYRPLELRGQCPCATCVAEHTGVRRVTQGDLRPDVVATEVRPVGRYAFQFVWSDGHSTGLYTFDHLRALDRTAPAAAPRRFKLPVVQAAPVRP